MATAATTVKVLPFADASPAELRAAILPEDLPSFDEQYREALRVAAEELRLDELESFLRYWRINARLVNHNGHDHWRRVVMDRARRIMAGERFPTVSEEEMAELIQARLAAAQ